MRALLRLAGEMVIARFLVDMVLDQFMTPIVYPFVLACRNAGPTTAFRARARETPLRMATLFRWARLLWLAVSVTRLVYKSDEAEDGVLRCGDSRGDGGGWERRTGFRCGCGRGGWADCGGGAGAAV